MVPEDVFALFGAHNLSNYFETERYTLSPRKITLHENCNPFTSQYDSDISLLEFEIGSILFINFVQPICLSTSEIELAKTEGIVTGWRISENNEYGNVPKLMNAAIEPNEKCLPGNPTLAAISSTTTFCAGQRNGSGVCHGDSGNGLFVEFEDNYYLKGIVSSSLTKDGSCDVSRNAVYTNVPQLIDWIENKIGGKLRAFLSL